MTNTDRRRLAWQVMRAALQAVDPALAVKNYFKANPELAVRIQATPGRVSLVGDGKAGAPMAAAITEIFGHKISTGRVVVKYGHAEPNSAEVATARQAPVAILEAGHPVPDEAGLSAARQIVRLLADASPVFYSIDLNAL